MYHPFWAFLNMFTILAPFFVLYIPFINFLSKGDHIYSGKMNRKQRVLGTISLTPLIILLLIAVDLLYTV
jgi:hypothetical protein